METLFYSCKTLALLTKNRHKSDLVKLSHHGVGFIKEIVAFFEKNDNIQQTIPITLYGPKLQSSNEIAKTQLVIYFLKKF